MPTSVALSSHFETFIRRQVDSGRFNNVSEVVRAGLRLLEKREAEQAARLRALREAIAMGLVSGPDIPPRMRCLIDLSRSIAPGLKRLKEPDATGISAAGRD